MASDPFYVSPGGAIAGLLDGKPVAGPLGTGDPAVLSAAASATTGVTAAVATDPLGGQQLLLASPDQVDRADPALKAETLTQPSFTRSGDEAWVVQNGANKPEVYRVSTSGTPSRERVPADELAGKGAVTALALSPDGVRVAIVADGQLYIGALTPAPAEGASAPTTSRCGRAGPVGRTDAGGDRRIDLAARPPPGRRPDDLRQLPGAGGRRRDHPGGIPQPVEHQHRRVRVAKDQRQRDLRQHRRVGAAVNEPMLITFGGRVWQLQGSQADGKWQSPVADQPFLNGSSPFYPS